MQYQDFKLDFYTEVQDLGYLVHAMGSKPFSQKFRWAARSGHGVLSRRCCCGRTGCGCVAIALWQRWRMAWVGV